MGNLLLNSLEIRNFRGFRHLQIDHLGKVNLVVGKNNVGKSSLLEALQLYAQRGSPVLIWEFLRGRDESRYASITRDVGDETTYPRSARSGERLIDFEDRLLALKYMFYGRRDARMPIEPVQIGPINSVDETLSITVGWYDEQVDEDGRPRRLLLQPEEYASAANLVPRLVIGMGKQPAIDYSISPSTFLSSSALPRLVRPELKEINSIFVGANGLNGSQSGSLWDKISLRKLEADVLASLRIIAPGVEGQSFVGDPGTREGRIPIVRISGIDEPLPLRSLGNGMQRVLGIALALANASDGILLVDEIENGIHYSVQLELWQLIFQLAHRLNVQVFATTHNWDCIEAFQKAAQEDKQEEGMLIRLELKKDEVAATLFDERRLGIATREQIEVR